MREGIRCSVLEPCPTNYTCSRPDGAGYGRCECSNPHVCGRTCADHGDCGEDELCSASTGTCVPGSSCLNSSMCPSGAVCADGLEHKSWELVCLVGGAEAAGAQCEQNSDCQSGVCDSEKGRCSRRCRSHADCSNGTRCVAQDDIEPGKVAQPPTCRPTQEARCDETCDGSAEYCRGDFCVASNCRTSGDCASLDRPACVIDLRNPDAGMCYTYANQGVSSCRDDEFVSDLGDACFVYKVCTDYSDCPDGYTCFRDSEHLPMNIMGVCGRRN